jgi:hypothetical protein
MATPLRTGDSNAGSELTLLSLSDSSPAALRSPKLANDAARRRVLPSFIAELCHNGNKRVREVGVPKAELDGVLLSGVVALIGVLLKLLWTGVYRIVGTGVVGVFGGALIGVHGKRLTEGELMLAL